MGPCIIGITVGNAEGASSGLKYESACAYSRAVADAGAMPVLLPQEPALAGEYVALCAGVMLTGGLDPRTEPFGEPTHPQARPMNPRRQAFEVALLAAIADRHDIPVLGVCLGMQMMALCAGGKLDQYLPASLGEDKALLHQGDRTHAIVMEKSDSVLGAGASDTVKSWHRQAVSHAGSLRVVARAPDGVVEAIDDPNRRFYLGVQWHPERGDAAAALSGDLIARFVAACRHGA